MEATALIVMTDEALCGACKLFKRDYLKGMIDIFKKYKINVTAYTAPDFRGLGSEANPRFLANVLFFPCIILIKNDLLKIANSLPDRDVLAKVSVFNGETLRVGSMKLVDTLSYMKYNMNEEGYNTFIEDFANKGVVNTTDTNIRKNNTSHNPSYKSFCKGVVPINSYGK